MFRSLPISLLVITAILAVAAPAANAVSYITVDGIKGTVAFNAPSAAAGGGSAGKVHYSDLTMTVHLDEVHAAAQPRPRGQGSTSTRWSSRSARPPPRRAPATRQAT